MANQEKSTEPFAAQTDEELVALAAKGETKAEECLIRRYRAFVRGRARTYFLIGADREDLMQEGMIGLIKAIRDYKPDKETSFKAFAEICVTRQIISAIKAATRQKHTPLNTYVSLSKPLYDEEDDATLLDIVGNDNILNPEEMFISREQWKQIEAEMAKKLSKFEFRVLYHHLQGKSYQEIAKLLGKDVKAIDNALQRIRKKTKEVRD